MENLKKIVVVLACIIVAVSCSNLSTGGNDSSLENNTPTVISEGMSYLGEVNKVFTASSGARYVTDQIIEDFFGHTVRFEGNLVEYNSIKQEILDYVESLESYNALMHQHYENVTYDPAKKYVEFSSYTDTTTGKVIRYEIRVFFGNFLETFETSGWYAKSVMFNSSFTRDMNSGLPVNFGEPLGEVEEEEITITNHLLSVINNVGTPARIYTQPAEIGALYPECRGTWETGGDGRYQYGLVAYSSVDSRIISAFESLDFNGMTQYGYSNVSYDSTKVYIEVCCYENLETGDIYDELRLVDSSYFTGSHDRWYAKIARLSDLLNSD